MTGHDNLHTWTKHATRHNEQQFLNDVASQELRHANVDHWLGRGFAILGGLIILCGVFLAILLAGSDGLKYEAIVSSLSTVVTVSVSVLFFRRYDKTRKNIQQTAEDIRKKNSRDDLIVESLAAAESITDVRLKNSVKAEIAREIIGKL